MHVEQAGAYDPASDAAGRSKQWAVVPFEEALTLALMRVHCRELLSWSYSKLNSSVPNVAKQREGKRDCALLPAKPTHLFHLPWLAIAAGHSLQPLHHGQSTFQQRRVDNSPAFTGTVSPRTIL